MNCLLKFSKILTKTNQPKLNCFSLFPKKFLSNQVSKRETNIVWVDLEMSGLDINKDHILEMACIITDKNLNIISESPNIIIKQSDEILNSMDDWCKRTHGESGLTENVKNSKIDLKTAEQMMLDFVQAHTPKGKCPLAGNSIHIDRLYLEKYMGNFLNHLHYRIIDVTSIKELVKRWYPDDRYFDKSNSHRALDDIKESIKELEYYRAKLFKQKI